MKRTRPPALIALLFLASCGPAGQDGGAPMVEEIPATTASEEALQQFRQGEALVDAARPMEARSFFKRAVELDPSFSYAYINMPALSAAEFEEQLRNAQAGVEGKSEGERLLVEVTAALWDNDTEAALRLAQQLVEAYPSSPRAWLTLAGIQAGQNDHEAARASAGKALELDPDMPAAHRTQGYSYLFSDPTDHALAVSHMERLVEIQPGEATAHEALGDACRGLGDLERARSEYSAAVELDPSLGTAILKKGHINSFLGRYAEARADYDAGIAAATVENKANYSNYRTFVHLYEGNPEGALMELGDVVAMTEEVGMQEDQIPGAKVFALTNAATIALHHGMTEETREILDERTRQLELIAATIADADFERRQKANIALWEGQLAARQGKYELARQMAETNRSLLEADANPRRFEGYHGLLGLIALEQDDYEQAAAELRQSTLAVEYIKYLLALALEGAGQTEEARRLFREVGNYNFNSVGFALVRKDALARAG